MTKTKEDPSNHIETDSNRINQQVNRPATDPDCKSYDTLQLQLALKTSSTLKSFELIDSKLVRKKKDFGFYPCNTTGKKKTEQ